MCGKPAPAAVRVLDMSDNEIYDDERDVDGPPRGCLPVADLPCDFEGEPQDGATYLALSK